MTHKQIWKQRHNRKSGQPKQKWLDLRNIFDKRTESKNKGQTFPGPYLHHTKHFEWISYLLIAGFFKFH